MEGGRGTILAQSSGSAQVGLLAHGRVELGVGKDRRQVVRIWCPTCFVVDDGETAIVFSIEAVENSHERDAIDLNVETLLDALDIARGCVLHGEVVLRDLFALAEEVLMLRLSEAEVRAHVIGQDGRCCEFEEVAGSLRYPFVGR